MSPTLMARRWIAGPAGRPVRQGPPARQGRRGPLRSGRTSARQGLWPCSWPGAGLHREERSGPATPVGASECLRGHPRTGLHPAAGTPTGGCGSAVFQPRSGLPVSGGDRASRRGVVMDRGRGAAPGSGHRPRGTFPSSQGHRPPQAALRARGGGPAASIRRRDRADRLRGVPRARGCRGHRSALGVAPLPREGTSVPWWRSGRCGVPGVALRSGRASGPSGPCRTDRLPPAGRDMRPLFTPPRPHS